MVMADVVEKPNLMIVWKEANCWKPSISAEDVEIASILNVAAKANLRPQAQNQNVSSGMSRRGPSLRQQHIAQDQQGSTSRKRAAAEPAITGEKRGRGRPRKEQPPVDQSDLEHHSGALKMPSTRLGQKQETAMTKAVTEEEDFEVPDDAPDPNARPTKPPRKQPQRNVAAATSMSKAEAAKDAAAELDSKRKKLNSQVKQRKANAIEEHDKSLKLAGKTVSNAVDETTVPEVDAPAEILESQAPSEKTLRNRKTGKGFVPRDDEAVDSIERQKSQAAADDDDSNVDLEYQPPGTLEESNLRARDGDADDGEDGDADAPGDGEELLGRPSKKQKRNQTHATQRTTRSPDLSESDAINLELFGRWRDWEIVLDGAKSVGVSNLKGKSVKEIPRLATNRIKGLVDTIKDATSLYRQLDSQVETGMSDDDIQNTEERLANTNQEIFEEVEVLSEEDAGNEQSEVIQDIYAHAMPNLIYWLKAALSCRSDQYSQEEDVISLQEVIRLQDLILDLCLKARQWKAKPVTDRPITNSTAQKINPYLRDIKRAFQQELERRERAVRQQSNDHALARSHAQRRERLERQKMLNGLKKAEQRNKIISNLRQKPSPYRTGFVPSQHFAVPVVPSSSYYPRTASIPSSQWTEEQDKELVYQLMRANTKYLPGMGVLLKARCLS